MLSDDVFLHGYHRLIVNLNVSGASRVTIFMYHSHCEHVIRVHRVSDRCLTVDLKVVGKISRIIALYLPHIGYP